MLDKAKLPAKLAKVSPNTQLLVQAVRVYLNNQREASAKTKTRGEVRKTTAKMYKQKGTGRARHGAYSAPIFVGGGVAFGPTGTQNYARKLSKSQAKLAAASALSAHKNLFTLDLKSIKNTSSAAKDLKNLNGSILVVLGSKETNLNRYFRNLQKVTVTNAQTLNPYQILNSRNLLFTPDSLDEISKKYVA